MDQVERSEPTEATECPQHPNENDELWRYPDVDNFDLLSLLDSAWSTVGSYNRHSESTPRISQRNLL
jgi:hypothetical protein